MRATPVAGLPYDGEIIRDEDQGRPQLPLQLRRQGGHLVLGRDVERGDGLVADDQFRLRRPARGRSRRAGAVRR